MNKNYRYLLLLAMFILVLTGCVPASIVQGLQNVPTPAIPQDTPPSLSIHEAQVDRVEMQIILSGPIQVTFLIFTVHFQSRQLI